MIPIRERCVEQIHEGFHSHRCPRRGGHEYKGKKYCKQHLPSEVEKRDARRNAAYAKWTKEQTRQCNVQQAQQKVLALAVKFHTVLDSGTPALWMMSEGPDELFKAVGRLKGLGWEPEDNSNE